MHVGKRGFLGISEGNGGCGVAAHHGCRGGVQCDRRCAFQDQGIAIYRVHDPRNPALLPVGGFFAAVLGDVAAFDRHQHPCRSVGRGADKHAVAHGQLARLHGGRAFQRSLAGGGPVQVGLSGQRDCGFAARLLLHRDRAGAQGGDRAQDAPTWRCLGRRAILRGELGRGQGKRRVQDHRTILRAQVHGFPPRERALKTVPALQTSLAYPKLRQGIQFRYSAMEKRSGPHPESCSIRSDSRDLSRHVPSRCGCASKEAWHTWQLPA